MCPHIDAAYGEVKRAYDPETCRIMCRYYQDIKSGAWCGSPDFYGDDCFVENAPDYIGWDE